MAYKYFETEDIIIEQGNNKASKLKTIYLEKKEERSSNVNKQLNNTKSGKE